MIWGCDDETLNCSTRRAKALCSGSEIDDFTLDENSVNSDDQQDFIIGTRKSYSYTPSVAKFGRDYHYARTSIFGHRMLPAWLSFGPMAQRTEDEDLDGETSALGDGYATEESTMFVESGTGRSQAHNRREGEQE